MPTNVSAYFLSIAFLLLGLIFVMLAIVCLPCIYRTFKVNKRQFFPKVFYVFIFINCVQQATYQIIFLIQVLGAILKDNNTAGYDSDFQGIFLQAIYVPDAIFFIVYFSLFWQFLIMMHNGHIKTGNILVGKSDMDPEQAIPIIRLFMYMYIIAQVTIILLYSQDLYISTLAIMIMDIVINASIPLIVIVVGMYMNVKFSGSPFLSGEYERRNNKMSQLLLLWVLLRIPQLVMNTLAVVYDQQIYKLFQGTLDISLVLQVALVFLLVGDAIIVQIIPLLMAMSNELVRALVPSDRHLTQSLKAISSEDRLDEFSEVEKQQKKRPKTSFGNLQYQDITFQENLFYRRIYGLGEINIGKVVDQQYAFRVITFKELSQFVIDETKQDINTINLVAGGVKILWYCVHQSQLILMQKYQKNGSLANLLHTDKQKKEQYSNQITASHTNKILVMKVNIALDIVNKLKLLHDANIIHGHLTTSNILFNKQFDVKIVDYGLRALKKYCGLVNGYINKSGYSAPECLAERGNVVSSHQKESDIYSYGMILYEIFTEKSPFKDHTPKQIQQLVLEQQTRPKINESVPEQIAMLIRYCWQQEMDKRPSLVQIAESLQVLKETLD